MYNTRVRAIASDVNAGVCSAERVARETLERISAYDAIQPEAWISQVPAERVLETAKRVDERIAAGESLPLAGVAVAIKDNIDVAGLDTTAACPAFSYRPTASAHVVERLVAAGAIVVGKTNLDQFATGLVGTRSPYGSPGCVYNREYISGGSSSGSAVVVAAGVVPLALGSDTAGSGRVPAAFNNLVGWKPTRGRWSSRGLVPACRTLDCITTLTSDVEDAALVDSVVTDFDRTDPYARRMPSSPPVIGSHFRFGIPHSSQLHDLPPQDAALFSAAVLRMQAAGGAAVEVDVSPLLEAAGLLYGGPWVAERTAALEALLDSQPAAIHPVVRAIVQAGKGISAALLMASIQSTMRTLISAGSGNAAYRYSAVDMVSTLNRQLYATTSPEKYATFYFALYDEDTHALTYTNAGHLAPILLRGQSFQLLDSTGTVVGAFPIARYEEKTIELEAGDVLVAYTDGIVEPENVYGEQFGEERLQDLLIKYQRTESAELIARAMEAVVQWTGAGELQDDMTMVVARRI